MIYKNEKRLSENKKFAFSLIEVLMALLIVSVLLVLMAPVITKKVTDKQSDGVVFTYDPNNLTTSTNACFISDYGNAGFASGIHESHATPKYSSKSKPAFCSEYSFVVPEGVHKINLTLVGGGGGGGGASGIEEKIVPATTPKIIKSSETNTKTESISLLDLKKATIDFLGVKGNDGKDANLQSYYGNLTCCGYASASCSCNSGSGGKSSPAIVNFDIPNEILRNNYEEKLERDPILTSEEKHNITIDTSNNLSSVKIESNKTFGKNFKYQISNSAAYFSCGFSSANGGTTYDKNFDPNDPSFSVCKLNEKNMVQPQEGQETQKWSATDSFMYPLTAHGGNGGQIPGFEKYGYGGKGASVKFQDKDDPDKIGFQSPNNLLAVKDVKQEGGPAYAQVTLHYEHYSAPGGGGAPGSAVRILSFQVNPGEEYIVRVGKGGAGGNVGAPNATDSNNANGKNGQGGSSTSISKKNENGTETLILIANGGAGGQGGQATIGDDDTRGMSATQYPTCYISKNYEYLIEQQDTKLINLSKDTLSILYNDGNYPNWPFPRKITYPAFEKNQELMKTLSYNKENIKTVGGTNLSQHYTGNTPNKKTVSLNGTTLSNAYDGLFEKTIVDNAAAFVGENGGFNGLSMKAGCGGLFMGNFDGRNETNQNEPKLINKFIVNGNIYNVSDYYDNCTMETPDGQSANFIMPNPINKTYGQAGAGGGGGGYSLLKGPGKGGDGQNGYLMIDWKK